MESLYYGLEQRADGWHAHPLDGDDTGEERCFATREDAIAWCRDHGLIARDDEPAAYGEADERRE